MRQIENITSETFQRHTIIFGPGFITLSLRYMPTVRAWFASVEYDRKTVNGVKLSVGVLHLKSSNLGFDLAVTDNSGAGIDPLQESDFLNGRCSLYLIEPGDFA